MVADTQFLYDGDCGLCQRTVDWLARRDTTTSYVPRAGLDAAYVVESEPESESPTTWRGHRAIGRALCLSTSPGRRLLGRILLWRLVDAPAALAYRTVATNRHRLGAVIGASSCAVRSG